MKEFIKQYKVKIIFVLILILAIFIRMFGWPTAISQVNCDEAMTAVNALSIAQNGTDMYGTSYPVYLEAWGIGGQSVALVYLMAFFIKIFRFSFATVRLPMLLISILSMILFYDLLKRIFKSEKIALIGFAFLAICPWHIMQSIWAIDCNLFPHFMLISVYLLYIGVTDKKWCLYLSMFFFGLTMYTYGVSVYVVPLFLLIAAIYLLRIKKINVKELLLCILIYIIVFLPILTMYFLNFFKIDMNLHIGKMTIQYFENNIRSSDMLFFSENLVQTLIQNIGALAKVMFIQYDDLEWNATPIFGTTYHVSFIFFIIGIVYVVVKYRRMKKNKKEIVDMESIEEEEKLVSKEKIGIFIFSLWLILSLILGILINDVNINRLNVIWYPMIFFIVLGVVQVIQKKRYMRYIIAIGYLVLTISFSIYFYSYYTSVIDMSGCFSRTYIDAVHFTSELAKGENAQPDIYFNEKGDGALDVYTEFQATIDRAPIECIKDKKEVLDKIQNSNQILIVHKEYIENNILFGELDISDYFQKAFEDYVVLQKVEK